MKDLPKVVKPKLGLGSDTNCKSPKGGDDYIKWKIMQN